MSMEFHKAYVSYLNVTRGAYFVNNSQCIKDTVHHNYWAALTYSLEVMEITELYINLAISIVCTVTAIIIVVIIFIKKAKYETDDDLPPEPTNLKKEP